MFNSNTEIWKNAAHGGGPWTDGPGPWRGTMNPDIRGGPWTRSRQGVHGPGVHVLYFPVFWHTVHYDFNQ